jgi:tetratricopeptide (TPR) repeat protein
LAVFTGGWTLPAAEAVCGDDALAVDEIVDAMQVLLESSLVRRLDDGPDAPRYGMLELIREYAQEQLAVHGEQPALQRRHAAYVAALAEEAAPRLYEADKRTWLDRLEHELDNVRSALAWAQHTGELELGIRIADALALFWEERGHRREGRAWLARLEHGLPDADDVQTASLRARALATAAWLACHLGDYQAAEPLAERSLALWRLVGRDGNRAVALCALAHVAGQQGDLRRQVSLFEDSLALFRAQGNTNRAASMMSWLGALRLAADDLPGAERLLQESLELCQAIGDTSGMAFVLLKLGCVAAAHHDFDRAQALLDRGLALHEAMGDRADVGYALEHLAGLAADRGDLLRARALAEDAVAQFRQIHDPRGLVATLLVLGRVAVLGGDHDCAIQSYRECLANLHAMEKLDAVFCIEGLAQVLVRVAERNPVAARLERPVRLFAAAAAERARLSPSAPVRWSLPMATPTHEERERALAAAHAALGAQGFETAWADGWRMPLAQGMAELGSHETVPRMMPA